MGKPTIKEIQATNFLDGSIVFENDAQIKGQLEGNVELEDLSETRSTYNIVVGPLYYGPDPKASAVGTFNHDPDNWTQADVSVLVWKAPRTFKIKQLQAHVLDGDETTAKNGTMDLTPPNFGGNTLNVAVEYKNSVASDLSLVPLGGEPGVALDGTDAFTGIASDSLTGDGTDWTRAHHLSVDATGYHGSSLVDVEIKAGQYVRLMLQNAGTGGTNQVQAIITVTLTVTEEHVE